MTEEAAMPPPPAYATFEEVEYSVYGFECDQWEEIPYPDRPDWCSDAERIRQNEYANQYQKYGGTPAGWSRYLALGFFGYEDCSKFKEVWNNFDSNPLTVHAWNWRIGNCTNYWAIGFCQLPTNDSNTNHTLAEHDAELCGADTILWVHINEEEYTRCIQTTSPWVCQETMQSRKGMIYPTMPLQARSN